MMARKAATTKKTVKKKTSSATITESSAKTATKAKKKTAKAATPVKKKRASRAKSSAPVRLKAFWGIYSQTLKRVAIFEYSQRKAANKKAAELSTSQKTPHFVKLVKEVIE